jgi:hypothetical protein
MGAGDCIVVMAPSRLRFSIVCFHYPARSDPNLDLRQGFAEPLRVMLLEKDNRSFS